MKTLNLIIIGLLISVVSISQTTVKKVTSTVAIDGLLEESFWDISNQITIGSSNNTANFGVLWDDNYLYVGVNVTDEILCTNDGQGFIDDGIEICIDGNNSQGTSFDNYDRIFVKPIRSYWIQEMKQQYEGVIHNWMETSSGYAMEFAIPWANFNTTPSAGMNIGFNIVVNDDEDCSNQSNWPAQLIWSGSSFYYNNPSIWGTLNLSSQTVSYSANYIALINPNGGDFYINNKTTDINWISNGVSNINIDYSTDNGSSWDSIATNLSASSGSYNWNVSATPSEQCLIKISETGNSSLNDISESIFTISAVLTAVEPLIPYVWENYKWPYNAYFPEDADGINGHIGNSCGQTSLARIIHYWEFPIVGNDELTYTDYWGDTWSANFGATTYNYDNMPNYFPENSTEEEYTDVATLTYHAATSIDDYFADGGDLDDMSYAMSHYFNYKVSTPAIRSDYTKAEWIKLLMNELDNGRVLLIGGMTTKIFDDWHKSKWVSGHWFHIDGYNEDGQFHGVLGFGDEDRYFDIENLFDYYLNNGVLIGLEPNLNGKELSLQSHDGEGDILANHVTEINWNSTSISNIRIEYTIDNGQNWLEIIDSTTASSGTYDWTTPNISSTECKIKLTDIDNINVYDKSDDVFSISLYELTLTAPNGREFLIIDDLINITWENTPVSDMKIEYSINNGSNWTEIISTTPCSSGSYKWNIPNEASDQCLIKISDVLDASVYDISESVFEIGAPNIAGGPYAVDDNTVLLLHFNDNLKEESHNYTVSNHGIAKSYPINPIAGLSKAIYFDNSNSLNDSYITVPNTAGEMSLNGNWTIEFWFYIESWDQSYNSWPVPIILPTTVSDANYCLELPSTYEYLKYSFTGNNENINLFSSQNSITTGQWYHVALMNDYDNNTAKLLLRDSTFQQIEGKTISYTAGDTISTGTQNLRIGTGLFTDNHFNGYIDELRISNVVRSFEKSPQANFTSNITSGTNPLKVEFTDNSTQGEASINQWNWDFGDGTNSTLQNPEHTYTTEGVYSVALTVTDQNGNSDSETKTEYITVNAFVNPTASFTSNLTSGTNPLVVDFTNNSVQGTTAITQWSWDFENDGTIDSYDQNPNWTYNEVGTFSVSLTVSDGTNTNTETKTDYINVTNVETSINNNYPDKDLFSIYPNPTNMKVYISAPEIVNLSIFNIAGQKIIEKNNFLNGEINLSEFSKGIYIITFTFKGGIINKKLIKK